MRISKSISIDQKVLECIPTTENLSKIIDDYLRNKYMTSEYVSEQIGWHTSQIAYLENILNNLKKQETQQQKIENELLEPHKKMLLEDSEIISARADTFVPRYNRFINKTNISITQQQYSNLLEKYGKKEEKKEEPKRSLKLRVEDVVRQL